MQALSEAHRGRESGSRGLTVLVSVNWKYTQKYTAANQQPR